MRQSQIVSLSRGSFPHRMGEVPIIHWPAPPKRLLRISAQLCNSLALSRKSGVRPASDSSVGASRYHHQARGRFPLRTTEKWGEGQGEDFKRTRQFDGTSPSPRACLAGRGRTRLQRWWVYQDAPNPQPRTIFQFPRTGFCSSIELNRFCRK